MTPIYHRPEECVEEKPNRDSRDSKDAKDGIGALLLSLMSLLSLASFVRVLRVPAGAGSSKDDGRTNPGTRLEAVKAKPESGRPHS
ncbi:MAG TPA: hypothetical protein VGS07_20675 [Thermoanaerobaculia bacterium]|jgi:hypothetical protein|nr:hypothetical protein [Thermoanaerobaculia bacterium]